jgi:hypothetical protein
VGTGPALLFGGPADALDEIAAGGTEQPKKRCCGTVELLHGVVPAGARHGSAVCWPVYRREGAGQCCAQVLGLFEKRRATGSSISTGGLMSSTSM